MCKKLVMLLVALLLMAGVTQAATIYSYELGATYADLSRQPVDWDLIEGKSDGSGATMEAGGFHAASTGNTVNLTDGIYGGNLDSILQDYGTPSLQMNYDLGGVQVWQIRSFAGNDNKDGRVFQNIDMEWKDSGGTWVEFLHAATTGPFYQSNSGQWQASLIEAKDDTGGPMFGGALVYGLRIKWWCPDNTQDWFIPRNEGPVCASIIKEVDVIPEPATIALLGLGGLALLRRKR